MNFTICVCKVCPQPAGCFSVVQNVKVTFEKGDSEKTVTMAVPKEILQRLELDWTIRFRHFRIVQNADILKSLNYKVSKEPRSLVDCPHEQQQLGDEKNCTFQNTLIVKVNLISQLEEQSFPPRQRLTGRGGRDPELPVNSLGEYKYYPCKNSFNFRPRSNISKKKIDIICELFSCNFKLKNENAIENFELQAQFHFHGTAPLPETRSELRLKKLKLKKRTAKKKEGDSGHSSQEVIVLSDSDWDIS